MYCSPSILAMAMKKASKSAIYSMQIWVHQYTHEPLEYVRSCSNQSEPSGPTPPLGASGDLRVPGQPRQPRLALSAAEDVSTLPWSWTCSTCSTWCSTWCSTCSSKARAGLCSRNCGWNPKDLIRFCCWKIAKKMLVSTLEKKKRIPKTVGLNPWKKP